MAKHIAPPATAEQIRQTLGITQEDMEIVERLLRGSRDSRENVVEPSSTSAAPYVEPPSANNSSKKRE
jgi:hypothetical protein